MGVLSSGLPSGAIGAVIPRLRFAARIAAGPPGSLDMRNQLRTVGNLIKQIFQVIAPRGSQCLYTRKHIDNNKFSIYKIHENTIQLL